MMPPSLSGDPVGVIGGCVIEYGVPRIGSGDPVGVMGGCVIEYGVPRVKTRTN